MAAHHTLCHFFYPSILTSRWEIDHTKNTTRSQITAWPCKYYYITQIWLCVHDHDDIDTINIGRASHKECEGRRHRAMLAVRVHSSYSHLLQPLLWPPTLSWHFQYMISLRKINQGHFQGFSRGVSKNKDYSRTGIKINYTPEWCEPCLKNVFTSTSKKAKRYCQISLL